MLILIIILIALLIGFKIVHYFNNHIVKFMPSMYILILSPFNQLFIN